MVIIEHINIARLWSTFNKQPINFHDRWKIERGNQTKNSHSFYKYGQASYTDWLHFEKCPNVTSQGTIPTVVSPINVQCLSVYTDKHCTLIGDISK